MTKKLIIILTTFFLAVIIFASVRIIRYRLAINEANAQADSDDQPLCEASKIFIRPVKFHDAIIERDVSKPILDMNSLYNQQFEELLKTIDSLDSKVISSPYPKYFHRQYLGLPNVTYLVDNNAMQYSNGIKNIDEISEHNINYSKIERTSSIVDIYSEIGIAIYDDKLFILSDYSGLSDLPALIEMVALQLNQYESIVSNRPYLIKDYSWPCNVLVESRIDREIALYKLKNYGLWSLIYVNKHPIKEFTKYEDYDSITYSSIEEFEKSLK